MALCHSLKDVGHDEAHTEIQQPLLDKALLVGHLRPGRDDRLAGDIGDIMTLPPQLFGERTAHVVVLIVVDQDGALKVVEIVSWAAGNGDRSENGDYIYGRQRLREIDRKLGRLSKQMKFAKVIDPSHQDDRSRVYFGATVVLADEDDNQRSVTIVGDDEADATASRIGWNSPLAKA